MKLEPTDSGVVVRSGCDVAWFFSFVRDHRGNLIESGHGYNVNQKSDRQVEKKRQEAKNALVEAGHSLAI